jgi:hypothetical protein
MLEFNGHHPVNKGSYLNFNGLMARLMGQRYMNARVKLYNGHLTYIVEKKDVTKAAEQMTKLHDAQKGNGKQFLFVLAPFQVPKYEDILPAGYLDYSNQNADDLLDMLRDNNVPFLDLREEMQKDGISSADAFFVTDHHWKPETGFWAFAKIVDHLAEAKIIKPVDPKFTDINEYNIEVYKDWFLGSAGKRTGTYYAGVDDISVIYPKFETEISLEIPYKNVSQKGAFSDVVFSRKLVERDFFNDGAYDIYGYGDVNGKDYRNANAPADLRVLFIRDSFACATATFFPLVATECKELDMRHVYGDFYGHNNFLSFYNEYEPDVIVVLVNAGSVTDVHTTYDYFGAGVD